MTRLSLKRALSLGGSGKGGGSGSNLLFLVGAGAVVALGAWYFLGHHGAADAKANFANSSNSIYPEGGDIDYGDSMNTFVPFQGQSSYIPHTYPHGGHRSFPDYTRLSNSLPTPFVEINFPYDSFNRGANLANVIDKCAYVSTYNGNQFSP